MTSARPDRPRLSLTAQVLALVLGTVIAAQAVTVLAVFLVPPSAPPVYGLVQVAGALRGQSFATDQGRQLRRRVTGELPADLAGGPESNPEATRLAVLLGATPDDVRVRRLGPPPFVMLTSGARPRGPPMGPGPPPFRPGPPPPGAPGPPFDDRQAGPAFMPLRGEFVAAWRQTDGRWAIVEPEPDLEWLRRVVIWIGGGALVMAPVGFWFARRISAPLQGFAASAEALGRDPHAGMMAPSGPAEIGVAARAFNAMQARLQRYVADRTHMVGAISHDLRTPLTRMRFKLEKADAELRDGLLSDVFQMERMIEAVIAFTQDSGANTRNRLDLATLVTSVADEAAETGADVSAPFEQPVVIEGDPVALRRLFANLIDNAVKYGGCARVQVAERGDEAVVSIADSGPGLPQRELEKVFTPFYRTEAAQGGNAPGVGLGLSIARTVARAHGGDVVLKSRPEGLIAEVVLPRVRA